MNLKKMIAITLVGVVTVQNAGMAVDVNSMGRENENPNTSVAVSDIEAVVNTVDDVRKENESSPLQNYDIIMNEEIPQDLDDSDIVVMDKSQVEKLGEDVQDVAESSKMIYITGDISDAEIEDLCGIVPEIGSDEIERNAKTATAIMCEEGEYYFNDVYDIVAEEDNDSQEKDEKPSERIDSE